MARTQTRLAFATAMVLLLCAGTLHRWAHVSRATEAQLYLPLAAPLTELPSRIGRFRLVDDLPLAADVLNAAGTDRFIQRDYVDPLTGTHLLLYVGYWGRENQGLAHGPEVCYPAVGWVTSEPPSKRTLSVPGSPGPRNPTVALHRFVRTEPERIDKRAVGFVAIVDGEYRTSSRGVFWHRPGGTRNLRGHHLAHVQVASSADTRGWVASESDIVAFMEQLMPHLARCLPSLDDEAALENPS